MNPEDYSTSTGTSSIPVIHPSPKSCTSPVTFERNSGEETEDERAPLLCMPKEKGIL